MEPIITMVAKAFGTIMATNFLLLIVLFAVLAKEDFRVNKRGHMLFFTILFMIAFIFKWQDIVIYFGTLFDQLIYDRGGSIPWMTFIMPDIIAFGFMGLIYTIPKYIELVVIPKEDNFILLENRTDEFELDRVEPEEANRFRLEHNLWLTSGNHVDQPAYYHKDIRNMTDEHIDNVINLLEEERVDLYGTNKQWLRKFKTEQNRRTFKRSFEYRQ
jgi:hypothetical protein